jgi:GTPase
MITTSFDPEAGTLYWYFTELISGSTVDEAECAATLLLDADGQVVGVELELDQQMMRGSLAFALEHPQASVNQGDYTLTVQVADEPPAEAQPLHEPAILDFDAAGRLQGCEILAAEEFGLAERLARLAPFMVGLEDEGEDGDGRDGPVVFTGLPTTEQSEAPTVPGQPISEHFRTGFVALVGRPNVGKSTLLNALLGQKVAIVSPKPQTTRMSMRGILSRPDAQIIFVDTPGIHDPRTRLGTFMVDQARRAIPDADVICFLVDITQPPGHLDRRIADLVRRSRAPRLLVLNKIDRPSPQGQMHMEAYRALGPWDMEVAVSALQHGGLETLVDEIVRRLPPGPPHYPTDQLTDQSAREQVAELVREQVLRSTGQEVPHGVAVEIEEWEEKEQAIYIRVTIYVEKESQKGILIGAGGTMLKRIGSNARYGVEALLGRQVFLDLWVKPRPNWRDDPASLHWLGYE